MTSEQKLMQAYIAKQYSWRFALSLSLPEQLRAVYARLKEREAAAKYIQSKPAGPREPKQISVQPTTHVYTHEDLTALCDTFDKIDKQRQKACRLITYLARYTDDFLEQHGG